MKRKFLAGLAIAFVIFGTLTPVFSFLGNQFEISHAYAADSQQQDQVQANVGTATLDCGRLDVGCGVVRAIGYILTTPPEFLAGISAVLFDWVLNYTISSDTYTSQDGVITASNPQGTAGFVIMGWRLVRDFSNLIFIFALFAIAFNLILSGTGMSNIAGLEPKRAFALVVIMALIVNFSFFLCRAAIDVGNEAAIMLYNSAPTIGTSASVQTDNLTQTGVGTVASFYSGLIAQNAHIKPITLNIVNQINPQSFLLGSGDLSNQLGLYMFICIMCALFNLFLIYIFLSTVLFFAGRTIGLYFAIILSPAAFVSVTIPSFKKSSYIGFDDWLKQFLGLVFLAPIYIVFIYLTVTFLNLSKFSTSGGSLVLAVYVMFKLALVGIILIFGKSVAKDMSGKVGAFTSGAITGLVIGAAGLTAAVATGGASGLASEGIMGSLSGAARAGGRYVAENAPGALDSGARSVLGDERVDQWKAKLSGLRNFNLSKMTAREALVGGAAALTGSETVRKMGNNFFDAAKLGQRSGTVGRDGRTVYDRAKAIQKIREDRDKKVDVLNARIADIKKKKKAGTPAQKVMYDKILKDLNDQKTKLLTPPPIPTPGNQNPPKNNNNNNNNNNTPPNNNNNNNNNNTNPPKNPNNPNPNQSGGGGGAAGGATASSTTTTSSNSATNTAGTAAATPPPTKSFTIPTVGSGPTSSAKVTVPEGGLLLRNTFNGTGKFEDEGKAGSGGSSASAKPFVPPVTQNSTTTTPLVQGNQTIKPVANNIVGASSLDKPRVEVTAPSKILDQYGNPASGAIPQPVKLVDVNGAPISSGTLSTTENQASTNQVSSVNENPTEARQIISQEINTAKTTQTLLEGISGGAGAVELGTSAVASNVSEKPKFGDGSAAKPQYTPQQQERILNKAVASQTHGSEVQAGIDRKQAAIAQTEQARVAKERVAEAQKQQQIAIQQAAERQKRDAEAKTKYEMSVAKNNFENNRNNKAPLAPSATTESKVNGVQAMEQQAVRAAEQASFEKKEEIRKATNRIAGDMEDLSHPLRDYQRNVDDDMISGRSINLINNANDTMASIGNGDVVNHEHIKEALQDYHDAFSQISQGTRSSNAGLYDGDVETTAIKLKQRAADIEDAQGALKSRINSMIEHVAPEHRDDILDLANKVNRSMGQAADNLHYQGRKLLS